MHLLRSAFPAPRSPRGRLCLAFAAGGLWPLAFWSSGLDGAGPLAWLLLVPLFVVVDGAGARLGAACGALWAAAATLAIAWWMPATLARFFDLGAPASWAAMALLCLAMALPYAGCGAWIGWSSRRARVSGWAVAAAFTSAELARAYLLGNPVALAAASQVGWVAAQAVDLVGPFGLGFVIAWCSALIAQRLRTPRGAWPREAILFATLAAILLVYGVARISGPTAGSALRVAVVESGARAEARHQVEGRAARLERHLALSRRARAAGAELVLWPESAIDFYLREASAVRDALLDASAGLGADLVLGAPHYRAARPTPRYHASVFVLRDGAVGDRYDKVHLVPFAESAPLGPRFAGARAHFSAGATPRLLETRFARLGAFVCGEAMFPDVARTHARNGASLLINPSNDGWYGHPAAARHLVQAAALRAVENRRSVVRAASGGPSVSIDPRGRIEPLGHTQTPVSAVATVRLSTVATPYQYTGELAAWIALVLAAQPLWTRRPQQGDPE